MALFNFFSRIKHRKFDYIPRYYNPEKEDLENRLSKYKKEKKSDIDNVKMNIQAGLRMRSPAKSGFNLRYNIMLLIIIAVLILITIYLFSIYLPKFMEVFGE